MGRLLRLRLRRGRGRGVAHVLIAHTGTTQSVVPLSAPQQAAPAQPGVYLLGARVHRRPRLVTRLHVLIASPALPPQREAQCTPVCAARRPTPAHPRGAPRRVESESVTVRAGPDLQKGPPERDHAPALPPGGSLPCFPCVLLLRSSKFLYSRERRLDRYGACLLCSVGHPVPHTALGQQKLVVDPRVVVGCRRAAVRTRADTPPRSR